jgi:hypothetical protein
MKMQELRMSAWMVVMMMGLLPAGQALCGALQAPQPPYVGVAYYPEVAGDEIDRDIRQMKAAVLSEFPGLSEIFHPYR